MWKDQPQFPMQEFDDVQIKRKRGKSTESTSEGSYRNQASENKTLNKRGSKLVSLQFVNKLHQKV